MTRLSPESQQAITGRARSMLKAVRRRLTDTRDLGYALAAAKMVVTVLEAQARESQLPDEVVAIGDELAADLDTVVEWLGVARDKVS